LMRALILTSKYASWVRDGKSSSKLIGTYIFFVDKKKIFFQNTI